MVRAVEKMSLADRKQLGRAVWAISWKESAESLEDFARHVVTKDEHETSDMTVKPFPTREEKPYIWQYLDLLVTEKLVAVEKSRQLLLTWATMVYILWRVKFLPNQLWFCQSKKEEDAANLVYNTEPGIARLSFMETHLPHEMRSARGWSYAKGVFDSGSIVWGIPEGGDKIRSYTASGIFSDEFAFQPEAEEAYKAALPALHGGGQFIAVSSARSGAYMQKIIERAV